LFLWDLFLEIYLQYIVPISNFNEQDFSVAFLSANDARVRRLCS
jgi:hypothetical protein